MAPLVFANEKARGGGVDVLVPAAPDYDALGSNLMVLKILFHNRMPTGGCVIYRDQNGNDRSVIFCRGSIRKLTIKLIT